MFTHDEIWAAIDRLADTRGLSASGLARQAGLDPTAFNKSKRISPNGKPRWPSTESLSKILAVTHCTMTDLIALMDQSTPAAKPVRMLSYAHVKVGKLNEKQISSFKAGFETSAESFAITIDDDNLAPLFGEGNVLIADPEARLKTGDRVIFYSRKTGLKSGIIQTAQKKALSILLADEDFKETSFADSDLEWTARIMWVRH
ncbi:MAG: peptidase [Micavibrio sp.]|nr:peptidase [Micavibrio sp.]